ncbi:MAG: IS110 family transposase [Lachnospiraceae bacterium]|nr:IS110 family transposase [Lachnospiraceae bacterium]
MIYLGIDVAKSSHVAAALTSEGEVVLKPFSFANSASGFCMLKEKLKLLPNLPLLIGLESTAHYGDNLICFLCGNGYHVAMLNPLQTAAIRKSAIRKTKTDNVDAFLIAKSLMIDGYTELQQTDVQLLKLKGLCKSRQNLILMRTRCKIQLGAFVDQLFPELNGFFRAGLHINVSYTLLKAHPRPAEVQSLHLTYLSNLLQKASRGKYTREDAIRLRELAKQSIGTDSPALALQIQQAITQIELFSLQLKQVDAEITSIMDNMASPIMTIPGIGHLNGAMILSCIGNIQRFSSPCKLLAYAGLDPAVVQSGNFNARSTRMSKRGNSMLRYAPINAAHNVVLNNDTFAQYYNSKVAQGKSHYCALGHTAHKLIRVIFVLLTRNIAFDLA